MAANAEPLEPAGTELAPRPTPRLTEALQGERPDFVVNPRRLAPVGKGVFIVVFGVVFAIAGTYAFWQAVQQARATGLAWGVLGTALLGVPFFLLGLAFAYGGVDALRPWRYWCAGTPTRLLLVGPRSTQEWPWASVDAEIVLEQGPKSTTLILRAYSETQIVIR